MPERHLPQETASLAAIRAFKDYAEAVKWVRNAAEQGYAVAQNTLGVMYGNGNAVPRDYTRAYMWFDLAAMAGYQGAVNNRDAAAHHMTPAQIAEAQKLAREWKPNMSFGMQKGL